METPRSNRTPKHNPTPRMSERKKKLFTSCLKSNPKNLYENDDSELGPMSPLKFSSSPIHYDVSLRKRTSFRNILVASSDEEDKESYADRYTNSNKYEILSNKQVVLPEDDDDTRFSFTKTTNNDCLERAKILRTPSETNNKSNQRNTPKTSFRKILDKDNGHTPRSSRSSPRTRATRAKSLDKENALPDTIPNKVRTSLSFPNSTAIPTKSFYSSTPICDAAAATSHKTIISDKSKLPKPAHITKMNARHRPKKQLPTIFNRKMKYGVSKGVNKSLKWYKNLRTHSVNPAAFTDNEKVLSIARKNILKTNTSTEVSTELNLKDSERTHLANQIVRVNNILKNCKNPIEMAKPLTIFDSTENISSNTTLDSSLNQTEPDIEPPPNEETKDRKIFKSGSNLKKSKYQLTKNLTATINNGKITIDRKKQRKRKHPSIFDDDDEEQDRMSEEHQEVDDIIKNLDVTDDPVATEDHPMSPTSQIRNMTSELVLNCATQVESSEATQQENLFPLFYKGKCQAEKTIHEQPACKRRKRNWRPIGPNQYQIDAGQKEFGATQCPECQLVYTMHEPEEEILHEEFHKSFHIFKFRGWMSESVVTEVPEWGVNGRIIFVSPTDGKSKWNKIEEILKIVDLDLGFVDAELHPRTVVYLAVDKSAVLGVCVVHPLTEANRLLSDFGLGIDCCSTEVYPVKCGISRIWVSPPYRRQGVAETLIKSMKSHFVFGCSMSFDDIAFSAPTDSGKALAAKVTKRADFLVYQSLN